MCFLAYFIDPSFLLQLLFGLVALDRPAVTLIKLFSCFDQQVVIPFFRLLFILLAQLLNFGHQLNKRLPYHLARCVVAPAWTEQILVFLKRNPALVESIWGEGGPLYLESRVLSYPCTTICEMSSSLSSYVVICFPDLVRTEGRCGDFDLFLHTADRFEFLEEDLSFYIVLLCFSK